VPSRLYLAVLSADSLGAPATADSIRGLRCLAHITPTPLHLLLYLPAPLPLFYSVLPFLLGLSSASLGMCLGGPRRSARGLTLWLRGGLRGRG
jgi:hypothetical protein